MANTSCDMAEAEKAYKAAEKCFILGDINGAIRWASPLSSSHRDLANALAAYEVHAAAALFPSRGENWHAVLGMDKLPASSITEDEVKKRYKRLCLVLHPDKNRSAAADGAFKLIRQAWEELSVPTRTEPDFWPRRSARAAEAGRSSRREASPDPGEKWWEWFGIPRDWWKEQETGSADDSSEQGASSSRWRSWRLRYASRHGPVYCWHCNSGYVEEEDETQDEESGERCHSCGAPLKLRVEATEQSPGTEEEGEVPPPPTQEEAAPRPPSSPIFMEEDEEEEEVPPPPSEEEAAPPPPSSPIFMEEDEEEEVPPPPEEEEAAAPRRPEPIFMEEEVPPTPPPPPRKKVAPPPPSEPSFMDEDEEEEEEAPPTPPSPREAPPRRRNGRYFPCPGQCRRCGARFSSTVSVGTWHVSCTLCHLPAKLHEIY